MRLAGRGTVTVLVSALIIGGLATAAAQPRPRGDAVRSAKLVRVSRTWPVMGTLFTATVWTRDSALAVQALHAAHDSVRLVDSLMSTYRPESEISRVNARAGQVAVTVSPQTFAVLRKARIYWQMSEGAFDPTVGPIINAWGFEGGSGRRPSPNAIDSLRKLVGYGDVELDSAKRTVRLPRGGMRLDLGGIAKGFALDLARRALAGPSIDAGTVDLGGNVLMFGSPPSGGKWLIAIVNPLRRARTIGEIAIDSGAVATSANYEHYLVIDGKRYGHIIDPRTAMPSHGVLSATAVGPLGEWSDGLSAALFLLGPERGSALVDSIPGISAIWVIDRGRTSVTSHDVICSRRAKTIFRLPQRSKRLSCGHGDDRSGDQGGPGDSRASKAGAWRVGSPCACCLM